MPKDTTPAIQNSFVMVSIDDLQRLQASNASGLAMRTYIALRSFMWGGKRTAFPSLRALAERMGYDMSKSYERTIGRTLKWLEDNGFIKRGHKRSKERFTLLRPEHRTGQDSPIALQGQNSPRKQNLEEQKDSPLNLPSQAKGATTKKQKVRSQRRRKRLRKRDRLHIAEVTEQMHQHQQQQQTSMERYKDAIQGAPAVLDGLESEHQCKETRHSRKEPVRAFFVASILHLHQRIDKLPPMPEKILYSSDLLNEYPVHHEILWELRLSVHELWEHIQRNL